MAGAGPWTDYQTPAAPAATASPPPWADYAPGTAAGDQHLLGYGVEGAAENAVAVPASIAGAVQGATMPDSGSIAAGAMPPASSDPSLDNPNGSNGPPAWLDPTQWPSMVHNLLVSHGAPAAAPTSTAQKAAYNAGGVVGRTLDAVAAPETIPAVLAANVAGEGARTAVQAGGGTPGEANAADFLSSLAGGGGFAAANRLVKRTLVSKAIDNQIPTGAPPTPSFEPPTDAELLQPNGEPSPPVAQTPSNAPPAETAPSVAGNAPAPSVAGNAAPPAAAAASPAAPASTPGLAPAQQAIEDAHWQRVGMTPQRDSTGAVTGATVTDQGAYDQAKADYAKLTGDDDTKGGRVVSTDSARALSPDYAASVESRSQNAAAVHEPSSAFAKQYYADRLAEKVPDGQTPQVLFTAGGTGSGKTTGLANLGESAPDSAAGQAYNNAHIIYDTNGNNVASAQAKIDQATAANHAVHYAYTYRDPVDAWENGALTRAERQGRTVPLDTHMETHQGSYEATPQIIAANQETPGFESTIIDNSNGRGNDTAVASIPQKRYTAPVEEFNAATERAYAKQGQPGGISPRVYNAPGVRQQVGSEAVSDGQSASGGNGAGAGLQNDNPSSAAGAPRAASAGVDAGSEGAPGVGGGVNGASAPEAGDNGPGAVRETDGNGPGTSGQSQAQRTAAPRNAGGAGAGQANAGVQNLDRRGVLTRVLGRGTNVRTSALEGNAGDAASDFQTSRVDMEGGNPLRDTIEGERQGMRDYSDALIQRSGGTAGADQLSRDTAGRAITAPLDDGYARMDLKIQRAYAQAKQVAQGKPIRLNTLNDLLAKNKGEFVMADGGETLLRGVQQRMQDLGLAKEGSDLFNPATVEQAEALRKSISGAWSPRTGHLITQMKNALDEDVTQAAGKDVYNDARATRYARSVMFDNPKGVSRLLGEADGTPNRTVPFERVQHEVTHLPIDQFAHLIGTYGKMAQLFPEMAPSITNAYREIRGAFANGVKAAGESTQGQWNQRAVQKFLAEHNGRMRMVFKPGEMAQFRDLTDAGQVLHIDRSYPGAAAQGHNLMIRGALKAVEKGGTLAGAVIHGPVGAGLGHGAAYAAEKMGAGMARRAALKRITTL